MENAQGESYDLCQNVWKVISQVLASAHYIEGGTYMQVVFIDWKTDETFVPLTRHTSLNKNDFNFVQSY